MQVLRRVITGHWQLMCLSLVIVLLWSTPAVLPLRILTVFLHETSHAIVTLATGGEVLNLTMTPMRAAA
ncbi:M50 family metallopeptidase [Phaeobacter piscinae]|uniref:M50 family metallopeptidase n=1 Tax=Phaeobacter piscinae TaxID=1580596 RepID=UPI0023B8D875|nr:M50 family metallopeptidase [Phaeobacter piscinae]